MKPGAACFLLVTLVGAFIATGAILAQGSSWAVFSSPSPATTNFLYDAAAISASDVWAVGYDYNGQTSTQSILTEHWDGTQWSAIPSPNPGTTARCGSGVGYTGNILNSVAALSTTNVWAVGQVCGYSNAQTLIEHWNGTKWSVVPSPNESGPTASSLAGVTAISNKDAWAVGNYFVVNNYKWETLIEHWDGTKWSIVSSPNIANVDKNFLLAVAAVSSNDVWAVGYAENTARAPYDVPLIEHYDGQSWTIVPSVYPAPSQYNQLYGIAVLAPNDIWAVGYANKNSNGQNGAPLIEHWDGTKWTLVSSPIAGMPRRFTTSQVSLARISGQSATLPPPTSNSSL
jgi:hypothetical protein